MKTLVLSYSQTGRNTEIGRRLSMALDADHVEVKELKKRKTMTVAWDLLFKRTPAVSPMPDIMDNYDCILFCAPVWMGKPATPLKIYLDNIGKLEQPFGFVTLCGGAAGPNPGIESEIMSLTTRKPFILVEMHIAETLRNQNSESPTQKQTQTYIPTDTDYEMYSRRAVNKVMERM